MRFEYVSCNICGSNKTRIIGKRESPDRDIGLETNVVQCIDCGLIYPNPMPRLMDNEIQDNFGEPEEYFASNVPKRVVLFENALDEIEKAKPDRGFILDVGCGRGEFLYVATRRSWQAIGTDISRAFVDYAKNNLKVNALVGDLLDLEFPIGRFDAVSLISVIQYLKDPMATLKKINALLKADGIIYIETTNEDGLIFKIGDLFESIRKGRKTTTHLSPLFPSFQIYGFNKRAISTALKKAGFQISYIKIRGMFGAGWVKGDGFCNVTLNFLRKIVVFIGGLTGNGHLIYCMAKKGSE